MNLTELLFKVSLLDNMSGPAGRMMSTMDKITTKMQTGYNKIGYGAAGVMGANYSLDQILQPAKDMQTALGEISSMNVGQDVLDKLNKTALGFSVRYGESAADFVHASYDIQGAISGLVGNELPAFTNASAILAKGTKADIATITNYAGTMYGIFQKDADAMGKADWINMMAGQTAMAVNIYKTTGQGMSEAFTNLGANAQTMNVSMAEQMAILGTLQATMSGSEAGTKYRAFLDGVGNAQDKLGLKFTNAQGKMLPMVEILDKIHGKYGQIDTVAKSDLLKKAFGTQEAAGLIKLLSTNIDGLGNSINEIGKQTGLQGAIDMANAMTQPWERAGKAGEALTIMLGQKMLPVLNPVYNGITSTSETLMRWMDLFPNITRYIGYTVFAVLGIIAALSALSVIVGISTLVMSGFGLVLAIITSPITATVVAIGAIGYAIYSLLEAWAQWSYGLSIFDTMAAGYEAAKLGVVSMIETTVNAFTSLKEWFKNFNLWEMLLSGADRLIGLLNKIPGINIDLGGAVNPALQAPVAQPQVVNNLNTPSSSTGPQTGMPALSALPVQPQWLQQPAPSLSAMATQPQWINQPAPGLLTAGIAPPPSIAAPAALTQSGTANVPKGGIMSQVNNANNSKTVYVGGISITNPSAPVTGQFLADELQMAAG